MAKTKVPLNPILSKRIAAERKLKKITQEQLAEVVEVTAQTIRKYESGRYGVPRYMVKNLADALGCCPEYLYGETNCVTNAEYQAEQAELGLLIQQATEQQAVSAERWKTTQAFFEAFLGSGIKHTHMRTKDDSFIPVVRITDENNGSYMFYSRHEAEHFLLGLYDDFKKLLHYHLLEHAEQQRKVNNK